MPSTGSFGTEDQNRRPQSCNFTENNNITDENIWETTYIVWRLGESEWVLLTDHPAMTSFVASG